MSDLEEKKKEDAWFQELNKRTTEREKKYIIGTDGKPILDSFGYPIIIKQTINFKTSDNSKKGWLYITQNNEYYFQDYNKTITKIKYIFKDKNDNIYFEDNEGNYYIEDKIININKVPPKYAIYFTYDENGNYIELDENPRGKNQDNNNDSKIIDFNSIKRR